MKVYISHSSQYDYVKDIYEPIKNSKLTENNTFFLSHESTIDNTKELIENCDLVIAEVSWPSTGSGIELGWANIFETPILCMCKKGAKPSLALKFVTNKVIEYEDSEDMIEKISSYVD